MPDLPLQIRALCFPQMHIPLCLCPILQSVETIHHNIFKSDLIKTAYFPLSSAPCNDLSPMSGLSYPPSSFRGTIMTLFHIEAHTHRKVPKWLNI